MNFLLKNIGDILQRRLSLQRLYFIKNVTLVALSQGLVRIKGLILAPIIISVLGKDGYGIWIQAFVTIALAASLSEMNLHSALVRFGAGANDTRRLTNTFKQIIVLGLVFSVVAAVLILLLAEPLSMNVLKSHPTRNLLKVGSCLVVVLVSQKISQHFFRAQNRFKVFAIITAAIAALEFTGIFVALKIARDPIAVIIGMLLGDSVVTVCMLYYIVSKHHSGSFYPRKSNLSEYLKLSVPALPTLFSSWIYTYIDRYFLSFYRGTGEVGIYSLANALGSTPLFLIGPLGVVIFPSLSRLWDEGKFKASMKLLKASIIAIFFVGLVIWIFIFFFSRHLLTLLSTQAEFGLKGRWVAPIVGLGTLCFALNLLLIYIFYLVKKTYYITIIFAIGAIINVVVNSWSVPRFGSLGASVGSCTCFSIMLLATTIVTIRLIRSQRKT